MSVPSNRAVSITHLSKIFSSGSGRTKTAVDRVSLLISSGEFVLIKGPSGSGKTTLISMIGCLMRPTSGSISVRDTDVLGIDKDHLAQFRLKHIGFVFQGFRLVEYLTVIENVLLPLALNGTMKTAAIVRAEKLLDEVGLSDRAQSVAKELSGGEQQRVAVARALANNPPLILADEPTGSLDSTSGRDIIKLLSDLVTGKGTTVIVVSHDDRIVPQANRVLVMEDGRIS